MHLFFKKLKTGKVFSETLFGRVLGVLLPILYNCEAERVIQDRIKTIWEEEGVRESANNGYGDVLVSDEETIKELYQEVLYQKEKLEEKSKSIVITVTISVTLILGLSSNLFKVYEYQIPIFLKIFLTAVSAVAIMYMIEAGISSSSVLLTKTKFYPCNVKINSLEDCRLCIICDRLSNTVRNNCLSTAYTCLRNSLVCLFLSFTLMIVAA